MVAIVLMGDVAPKQSKGKAKDGERAVGTIKLGRYAVLLQLVEAFADVEESAGSGTRLRGFVEAIESRLGMMIEAEVSDFAGRTDNATG